MSFLGISLIASGAAPFLGAVEKALSLTTGSFESFPAEPVYAANGSLGFVMAGVAGLDVEVEAAGLGVEVGVAMAGVAGLDVEVEAAGLGVEVGVAGLGVEVGVAIAGVVGFGVEVGVAGLGVEVGVAIAGVVGFGAEVGVAGFGVVSDEEFGVGLGAETFDPELGAIVGAAVGVEAGDASGETGLVAAGTELLPAELLFSLVGESPNIEFIDSSAVFVTFVKSLK